MAGRNLLTGIGWHEEWHNTDPKKDKAADCVFLTKERLCRNRKSPVFDNKCFVATHCKYRVRSGEEIPADEPQPADKRPQHKQRLSEGIVGIDCTMPIGCKAYSNAYGQGIYRSYDKANRLISVEFDTGLKWFRYPEALFNKHIIVGRKVFAYVIMDSKHAERK